MFINSYSMLLLFLSNLSNSNDSCLSSWFSILWDFIATAFLCNDFDPPLEEWLYTLALYILLSLSSIVGFIVSFSMLSSLFLAETWGLFLIPKSVLISLNSSFSCCIFCYFTSSPENMLVISGIFMSRSFSCYLLRKLDTLLFFLSEIFWLTLPLFKLAWKLSELDSHWC